MGSYHDDHVSDNFDGRPPGPGTLRSQSRKARPGTAGSALRLHPLFAIANTSAGRESHAPWTNNTT
jgi:hypothetical protein